jgi:hypothetical protein
VVIVPRLLAGQDAAVAAAAQGQLAETLLLIPVAVQAVQAQVTL